MTRCARYLALLALGPTLLAACADSQPATPPPSRVVAVAASAEVGEGAETFCEVSGSDVRFDWPDALSGSPPAPASGWRWINVWATWCRPCVDEMPRLNRFRSLLASEGIDIELVFVSADTEADAVDRFVADHPEHPTGPRIPETEALKAWLESFGLDRDAPLPVHLFVDPGGVIRCARTAAVGEDDYASVKRLLAEDTP